ncbi:hypothetical protein GMRT_14258 [Giardia muris]|uniref:Uncharacterized protein n=1 Tax=Giardia muris TaxID=5742 RepID=A0A4Z1TCH5_GIAMU|nr:hypothetical protein GMRT_14258 [Giardia muris]|eukprot:TNJ30201.1 hypothetical protein GMRT_14258 [Giardia muris]
MPDTIRIRERDLYSVPPLVLDYLRRIGADLSGCDVMIDRETLCTICSTRGRALVYKTTDLGSSRAVALETSPFGPSDGELAESGGSSTPMFRDVHLFLFRTLLTGAPLDLPQSAIAITAEGFVLCFNDLQKEFRRLACCLVRSRLYTQLSLYPTEFVTSAEVVGQQVIARSVRMAVMKLQVLVGTSLGRALLVTLQVDEKFDIEVSQPDYRAGSITSSRGRGQRAWRLRTPFFKGSSEQRSLTRRISMAIRQVVRGFKHQVPVKPPISRSNSSIMGAQPHAYNVPHSFCVLDSVTEVLGLRTSRLAEILAYLKALGTGFQETDALSYPVELKRETLLRMGEKGLYLSRTGGHRDLQRIVREENKATRGMNRNLKKRTWTLQRADVSEMLNQNMLDPLDPTVPNVPQTALQPDDLAAPPLKLDMLVHFPLIPSDDAVKACLVMDPIVRIRSFEDCVLLIFENRVVVFKRHVSRRKEKEEMVHGELSLCTLTHTANISADRLATLFPDCRFVGAATGSAGTVAFGDEQGLVTFTDAQSVGNGALVLLFTVVISDEHRSRIMSEGFGARSDAFSGTVTHALLYYNYNAGIIAIDFLSTPKQKDAIGQVQIPTGESTALFISRIPLTAHIANEATKSTAQKEDFGKQLSRLFNYRRSSLGLGCLCSMRPTLEIPHPASKVGYVVSGQYLLSFQLLAGFVSVTKKAYLCGEAALPAVFLLGRRADELLNEKYVNLITPSARFLLEAAPQRSILSSVISFFSGNASTGLQKVEGVRTTLLTTNLVIYGSSKAIVSRLDEVVRPSQAIFPYAPNNFGTDLCLETLSTDMYAFPQHSTAILGYGFASRRIISQHIRLLRATNTTSMFLLTGTGSLRTYSNYIDPEMLRRIEGAETDRRALRMSMLVGAGHGTLRPSAIRTTREYDTPLMIDQMLEMTFEAYCSGDALYDINLDAIQETTLLDFIRRITNGSIISAQEDPIWCERESWAKDNQTSSSGALTEEITTSTLGSARDVISKHNRLCRLYFLSSVQKIETLILLVTFLHDLGLWDDERCTPACKDSIRTAIEATYGLVALLKFFYVYTNKGQEDPALLMLDDHSWGFFDYSSVIPEYNHTLTCSYVETTLVKHYEKVCRNNPMSREIFKALRNTNLNPLETILSAVTLSIEGVPIVIGIVGRISKSLIKFQTELAGASISSHMGELLQTAHLLECVCLYLQAILASREANVDLLSVESYNDLPEWLNSLPTALQTLLIQVSDVIKAICGRLNIINLLEHRAKDKNQAILVRITHSTAFLADCCLHIMYRNKTARITPNVFTTARGEVNDILCQLPTKTYSVAAVIAKYHDWTAFARYSMDLFEVQDFTAGELARSIAFHPSLTHSTAGLAAYGVHMKSQDGIMRSNMPLERQIAPSEVVPLLPQGLLDIIGQISSRDALDIKLEKLSELWQVLLDELEARKFAIRGIALGDQNQADIASYFVKLRHIEKQVSLVRPQDDAVMEAMYKLAERLSG